MLDSFAAQDFTKDPSSMANVALDFAHLCLKISWKLDCFRSLFCRRPNFFQMTKKIKSVRSQCPKI